MTKIIGLSDDDSQLNIFNRFSVALIDVTDKNELFWMVAREVVSKLGFVDCVIYERQGHSIVQRAAFGIKNPFENEIINPLVIPIGKGVTGNVAKTGKATIISDARNEPNYICDVETNLSEIAVPIIYDGQVQGIIDCEDPRISYFNQGHLRALTTVAAMLSSKLLQYDIYHELLKTNQALNKEIEKSKLAELALQRNKDSLELTVKRRTDDLQDYIDELLAENLRKLKAEEALRVNQTMLFRSSKMASIGVLAAGVAHEINNPIAFVKSNLQTMEEYLEDLSQLIKVQSKLCKAVLEESPNLQKIVQDIKEVEQAIDFDNFENDLSQLVKAALDGTSRVIKIVSELKEYSRKENQNREKHSINALIDKALSIAANEVKHKAEIDRDYGDLTKIYCWGDKLVQVFLNLIVNAAQAIKERGIITIKTRTSGENIIIQFTDSGRGMSEEVRAQIFDPFYTTKDVGVGTGLGLHISYNIIENHEGEISVTSEEFKGTCITITLPKKMSDDQCLNK